MILDYLGLGFILASLLGAGLTYHHDHRLNADEIDRRFRTLSTTSKDL